MNQLCVVMAAVLLVGCGESETERLERETAEAAASRAVDLAQAKRVVDHQVTLLPYNLEEELILRGKLERETVAGRAMVLRDDLQKTEAELEKIEDELSEALATMQRLEVDRSALERVRRAIGEVRSNARDAAFSRNRSEWDRLPDIRKGIAMWQDEVEERLQECR